MISPAAFWRSTVGKKIVMAATGLIMIGFVVGHVLGNLLVFRGPEKINAYSAFLRGLGGLLWLVRAVLLASVILHIVAAIQLTRAAHAARPAGYVAWEPQASTVASRTIRWGGFFLAIFILLHLLHFTTGTIRPAPFSHGDVYRNVVGGFRIWWVSLFYIAAMVALGLHLYHGTWSSLRTLGLEQPTANPLRRPFATVLAVFVWAGFTAIPVAVLLGVLR